MKEGFFARYPNNDTPSTGKVINSTVIFGMKGSYPSTSAVLDRFQAAISAA
ncbi:MAG: hypothetical protein ACRD9L_25200 [Bryobacteraceae bacterium]